MFKILQLFIVLVFTLIGLCPWRISSILDSLNYLKKRKIYLFLMIRGKAIVSSAPIIFKTPNVKNAGL